MRRSLDDENVLPRCFRGCMSNAVKLLDRSSIHDGDFIRGNSHNPPVLTMKLGYIIVPCAFPITLVAPGSEIASRRRTRHVTQRMEESLVDNVDGHSDEDCSDEKCVGVVMEHCYNGHRNRSCARGKPRMARDQGS
jgi:hypothetical protein